MTITLTKTRRITCTADETVDYEVDKEVFEQLISEGMSEEEALEELRSQGAAESTNYDVTVDEVVCEHSVDVTR